MLSTLRSLKAEAVNTLKKATEFAMELRHKRFQSRAELEMSVIWDGKETFTFTSTAGSDLLPED